MVDHNSDGQNRTGLRRFLEAVARAALKQWIVLILLAFLIFFSASAPGFFSLRNIKNIASYSTEPLALAVGETFVIISGGIDLSVGSVLALSGIIAALTMKSVLAATGAQYVSITLGVLAGLLTGIACGFINGIIIARLKVPPFVVTLGMLGIARGLTFLLTAGASVTGLPEQLAPLGNATLFGYFPLTFAIAVGLTLVAAFVLSRTKLGQHVYAIGGNPRASLRAGIPIARHLVTIYVISGFFAASAGVLLLARFTAGSPIAGQQSELDAIAAAVIGGASLFGGVGSILGSVVGAFIIGVLLIGLVISNVPPYWQLVATGTILIIAVFIDQMRNRAK